MTAVIQLILTAFFFFNVKVFLSSKMGKAISLSDVRRRAKRGQVMRPTSLGSCLAPFFCRESGILENMDSGFRLPYQIPVVPVTGSVTLGKLLNLSEP